MIKKVHMTKQLFLQTLRLNHNILDSSLTKGGIQIMWLIGASLHSFSYHPSMLLVSEKYMYYQKRWQTKYNLFMVLI